ncbi:unnamed protein product [Rotaria sordida]|uniref:Uncharacterized protein n=1 Tax=Rotaria sordida TaxID=392033 RepID=A0A814C818_9BILA|nr:unnamed protein product [Rotaria sordida]CAF0936434.1 unnamed protein product [Rotaria sordida]CAF1123556.1 unnamed protein product [Rotaria sordida]CAF3582735.1 unnamed protein product [Rotaria sordida]
MTTKQDVKLNTKNNISRSSPFPPALYQIQYPNCRTGMFSLRVPFKNFHMNNNQQQISTHSSTPNVIHPEYLHVNQLNQQELSIARHSLQRDAQVQCSLVSLDNHDKIDIQRQKIFVTNSSDSEYFSPRYRVQLQLRPMQPNIYEVWNVETPPPPPPRSIPINEPIKHREPSIRIRSPRLVDIKPMSDDESDYDDHIVYTHRPRRTYLPANVRMVCVRQDANTICY